MKWVRRCGLLRIATDYSRGNAPRPRALLAFVALCAQPDFMQSQIRRRPTGLAGEPRHRLHHPPARATARWSRCSNRRASRRATSGITAMRVGFWWARISVSTRASLRRERGAIGRLPSAAWRRPSRPCTAHPVARVPPAGRPAHARGSARARNGFRSSSGRTSTPPKLVSSEMNRS